jgi:hypothetical protein
MRRDGSEWLSVLHGGTGRAPRVLVAGLVVVGYGLLAALYASRGVAQAETTAPHRWGAHSHPQASHLDN